MNHVDPSTSSGSSPGGTLTIAPRLHHIPAVDSRPTRFDVDAFESSDCGVRVPVDLVVELTPIQSYLLRLILFQAGKTILHRGRVVEILEQRTHIRQVVSLFPPQAPFWVPRRALDRKRFLQERRKRGRLSRALWHPPHFTGDPRPEAQTVTPRLEIPEDLYLFCKTLGYPGSRLVTMGSSWSIYTWSLLSARPTRAERKQLEERTRRKSDDLRAKLRKRLLRRIVADSRLPEEKQLAVYDVLGLGQTIEQAASARKVSRTSLGYTVRRIITKTNQAYRRTLTHAGTP
jgi:hypothetical protein